MYNVLGSLDLIRKINRSLIIQIVKAHQPISRAQISRKLNLSKTTVIEIVEDLVKRKLLIELGEEKTSTGGGRPAIMFGFNPKSAYGVGIDIGGTKILIVITDLDGNIIFTSKYPTTSKVEEIIEIIKLSIEQSGLTNNQIIGIGIGVPGSISENKVRLAKSLGWTNFDLVGQLKTRLPFPIFINNDVKFSCIGERWLGSGNMSNDILFIAIGTGVGSAILSNGYLVNGADNRAGEICYITSKADYMEGNLNVIGKYSVFEEKVSGTFLNRHGVDSETLLNNYKEGNSSIDRIVDDFILDLSFGIANAVSLVNPEYVIIGGGVSESMSKLVPEIQKLVDTITPIKTKIKLATLGEKAGALGAVAYTFNQLEQL
jgi:glucokinase